ncbi:NADPH-dependent F420 reductase [Dyadobacter sp. 3J3]|uniref:NADPH-dependent F420 reductase n=1 Tax=Dyadobacter sp. 3J3 TaxID=2606600 RepID=UPI00135BC8D6|nr:NAD(P)-binding domain-containing protein [Dyadobacter sp. 3J3]
MKTIGIIGAGNIGKTVATHLLKNGFSVLISNSKDPESLNETILSLGKGAKAVTAIEAASADMVVLALPWSQVPTLTKITDWTGRIIIDATNHFKPDFQVEDLAGRASSEVVQDYLPGAKLVKAFNTLFFKVLEQNPVTENGHRVLFMSGDDTQAKVQVSEVIEAIGFAPVDLGSLAVGSKLQQAKGLLSTLNLVKF